MNFHITHIKPFGILVEALHQNQNIYEIDIEHLREYFLTNQLIVIRGFKTFKNSDEFVDYSERWGEISLWPFGKVLELIERENPEDHIFDNNYIPLHWDGMYRPQVPEYQIFHCAKAPLKGQGGETTFSNTHLVLENTPQEIKKRWSEVKGTYKRKMEFYESKTVAPIITTHPTRGFPVIRYNEPPDNRQEIFLNPPELQFTGAENFDEDNFHQSLKQALYDSRHFYAHEWQIGDVVIADNFSLLHGRNKFISKSPRHLQRIHILSNPIHDNPFLESHL